MDRQIVYPGQIPLETDLLKTNKNMMIGLSKLAAAVFGTSTFANGLACTPNSPADLTVLVAPGEIYTLKNIDDSAYSSLIADTTHQILKQGVVLDTTSLSCPAPGTGGFSINYLVQAAFVETDGTNTVLPYYNASNPSQAWSGMNNNGVAQSTVRADLCNVTVKAGTAAATGSQTTPAPDSGNVGLWVVTVANGQTTITAGNISQYAGAPFIAQAGAANNAHNAMYPRSVAGNSDVTLDAAEAAYPIIKLTGALTGNIIVYVPAASRKWTIINATTGAYTLTVKTLAGTGYAIPQGIPAALFCDGTNVDLQNELGATPAPGDNSKKLANSEFVQQAIGQLSFRNKIINGDMSVSRINGSSAVTVTAGAALQYVIDRFYVYCSGANVTAQRIAGSGSDRFRHQITGAAGVTAIGIGQRIEAADVYELAGNTAIFGVDLANSFLTSVTWTAYYANTADTFGTLAAPTRTQIATGVFTVNPAVGRYYTPAIAIPAGATTGIEIVLSVGAQTSGTFTHGKWQLEQVAAGATSGTTFERVPYSDQLRRCQRYLPLWSDFSTDRMNGPANTATSALIQFVFKDETRVPVTGEINTAGLTVGNQRTGQTGPVQALAVSISSTYGVQVTASWAAGFPATNPGDPMQIFGATTGILYFTGAEL